MRAREIAAFAPAIVLVAASGVLLALDRRDVVITTRLGALVLAAGAAAALAAAFLIAWRVHGRRRAAAAAAASRDRAAAEHRRFLDRLDHELKNPVTAIRAAVAMSADATPHLATIDAQTARLSHLVADLRKLSELQTAPIERVAVDVSALVAEVADAIEDAHGRTVSVVLPQAPWPLPVVSGDPDLLFVAVFNVVSNSVKYSEPGDAIEVRGSERGGRVVIDVADTGRGIPDADLAGVFDELTRAGNARDRPGSGLGLALVRTIVDRHGGAVGVVSQEGRGTRVTLELPRSRE